MLEADHGCHAKRPYQKHGHQSQPWTDDIVERIHGQEDYDISVMWSEWINTVCQTLRYMVEWK